MIRLALVFALALIWGAASAETAPKVPPQNPVQVRLSFAPVVKKVTPAVVNVYASRVETAPRNPLFDDPIFRQLFGGGGDESRVSKALGSGVIVDPSGLVVTNYHVIEGMTQVKVALSDRREFEAEIVLRDPRTDLAVLSLKGGQDFPVLELGDSDALEVGDFVIAVGDPFGVGQTVTQGIVSALARTQVGISDYGFFIQTDAAINPGNSGGALVDLDGKLVGINSAIYSRTGGNIGIGFAIPVNMVKGVDRRGAAWRRDRQTAVARRHAAESDQGYRRQSRHRSPDGRAGGDSGSGWSRGRGGPQARRPHHRGRRSKRRRRRGRRFSARGQAPRRLGSVIDPAQRARANPAAQTCRRAGNPASRRLDHRSRSPFEGAEVMNMSPAVAEELSLEGASQGVVVARSETIRPQRSRRAKGGYRRRSQRPENRNDARSRESVRGTRAAVGSDHSARRGDNPQSTRRVERRVLRRDRSRRSGPGLASA